MVFVIMILKNDTKCKYELWKYACNPVRIKKRRGINADER